MPLEFQKIFDNTNKPLYSSEEEGCVALKPKRKKCKIPHLLNKTNDDKRVDEDYVTPSTSETEYRIAEAKKILKTKRLAMKLSKKHQQIYNLHVQWFLKNNAPATCMDSAVPAKADQLKVPKTFPYIMKKSFTVPCLKKVDKKAKERPKTFVETTIQVNCKELQDNVKEFEALLTSEALPIKQLDGKQCAENQKLTQTQKFIETSKQVECKDLQINENAKKEPKKFVETTRQVNCKELHRNVKHASSKEMSTGSVFKTVQLLRLRKNVATCTCKCSCRADLIEQKKSAIAIKSIACQTERVLSIQQEDIMQQQSIKRPHRHSGRNGQETKKIVSHREDIKEIVTTKKLKLVKAPSEQEIFPRRKELIPSQRINMHGEKNKKETNVQSQHAKVPAYERDMKKIVAARKEPLQTNPATYRKEVLQQQPAKVVPYEQDTIESVAPRKEFQQLQSENMPIGTYKTGITQLSPAKTSLEQEKKQKVEHKLRKEHKEDLRCGQKEKKEIGPTQPSKIPNGQQTKEIISNKKDLKNDEMLNFKNRMEIAQIRQKYFQQQTANTETNRNKTPQEKERKDNIQAQHAKTCHGQNKKQAVSFSLKKECIEAQQASTSHGPYRREVVAARAECSQSANISKEKYEREIVQKQLAKAALEKHLKQAMQQQSFTTLNEASTVEMMDPHAAKLAAERRRKEQMEWSNKNVIEIFPPKVLRDDSRFLLNEYTLKALKTNGCKPLSESKGVRSNRTFVALRSRQNLNISRSEVIQRPRVESLVVRPNNPPAAVQEPAALLASTIQRIPELIESVLSTLLGD